MRPKKNIPPPPKPGQEPQPGQLQRRIPAPLNPANNTLLCLNIPENIGAEVLQALFGQYYSYIFINYIDVLASKRYVLYPVEMWHSLSI